MNDVGIKYGELTKIDESSKNLNGINIGNVLKGLYHDPQVGRTFNMLHAKLRITSVVTEITNVGFKTKNSTYKLVEL